MLASSQFHVGGKCDEWRKRCGGDTLVIEVELNEVPREKIGKGEGVCIVEAEPVSEAEGTLSWLTRDEADYRFEPLCSCFAVIHPKAEVGGKLPLGPFCVIGENVAPGKGCRF